MRVVRQLFKYSLGLSAPATIHQADCVFVFIYIACNIFLSYSDSLCIFCSIFLSFSCSISSSSFSLNSRCNFFSIFVSFSIYNSLSPSTCSYYFHCSFFFFCVSLSLLPVPFLLSFSAPATSFRSQSSVSGSVRVSFAQNDSCLVHFRF